MAVLQHPQQIEDQLVLHLDVPTSLEVDGNTDSTQQQLELAIDSMDQGAYQNGKAHKKLVVLSSYGATAKEKFQNFTGITPNQLCIQMKTIEQAKEYLHSFSDPAIFHNHIHLGYQISLIFYQGDLINSQQAFFCCLYDELSGSMTNIIHQINSLVGHQNHTATWSAQIEEHMANYLAVMIGSMLKNKEVGDRLPHPGPQASGQDYSVNHPWEGDVHNPK
ncbi:hypothetical protein DSO57_1019699 [Entomophthora muscae]|uniref:Uncharacterized protein n=1 Tax=Entomophthora muscae TaxID=34485 RepID=A0ACC2TRF0_9FUNG|nr:hypothetical protein DSO57_1019699 [Entomophthora muscae]